MSEAACARVPRPLQTPCCVLVPQTSRLSLGQHNPNSRQDDNQSSIAALTAILNRFPGALGLSCFRPPKGYFTSTLVRIHGWMQH